jgi:hypothetical protein
MHSTLSLSLLYHSVYALSASSTRLDIYTLFQSKALKSHGKQLCCRTTVLQKDSVPSAAAWKE